MRLETDEMIPLSLTVVHLMYRIDFAAAKNVTCVEIHFSSISAAEAPVLPSYGVTQSIRFSKRAVYNLEFFIHLYIMNYTHTYLSPFSVLTAKMTMFTVTNDRTAHYCISCVTRLLCAFEIHNEITRRYHACLLYICYICGK